MGGPNGVRPYGSYRRKANNPEAVHREIHPLVTGPSSDQEGSVTSAVDRSCWRIHVMTLAGGRW